MGVAETVAPVSGPLDPADAAGLPAPPVIQLPQPVQLLRFNQRQIEFVFGARRRHGDVFAMETPEPLPLVITSLPDDVRSLFTAKPEEAPSLAAESPLRPIVGPDSVLTSLGERHLPSSASSSRRWHAVSISKSPSPSPSAPCTAT
jgi:cytochrome P450 family 135